MKSLELQISDRCIHFNGIMNDCCKAGIKYADVRIDRPYKFPCLKQGGECSSCQFPTGEEVKNRIGEITDMGNKSLVAYAKIKEHIGETKGVSGVIDCECGGKLKFSVASTNGHIWAACSQCGISFVE